MTTWVGRLLGWLLLVVVGLLGMAAATADASGRLRGYRHACGAPAAHSVRCFAELLTTDTTTPGPNSTAAPLATTAPAGYGPADLWSAYQLSSSAAAPTGGVGQRIAIVDAYDDPNAEADLGVYRSTFGLSPCTTANGCFRKVSQSGGTTYPKGNAGWGQEISLDLDMASAICPNCKILLVEATSASQSNLSVAVDRAALLGATQISNSYGASEYSGETSDQSHYNHPGIDITVSSGDDGYGAQFPAASQYVTAVGGTSLTRVAGGRGWSETVWNGAGSGCSRYVAKPSWQTDASCARRTIADISAVADPNTGVAVYDTYGSGGWLVFGGTSVSSPLVASVDALAGGRASSPNSYGSFPYANPSSFFDVTSGSNGSCGGTYLCAGKVGYDGPTGWGTPNGSGVAVPPPPAALTGVAVSPTSVTGGGSVTGTVTLSAPAGVGGANVTLASDNAAASAPPSVTVATNATTASFPITTTSVSATQNATITATFGSVSKTAGLAVLAPTPLPAVSGLALNPTSVPGGASSTATVTLTGAAPPTGATVALASNNGAASVPASVNVVSGATTASFAVATTGVATAQSATISASYNSTSQTAALSIQPVLTTVGSLGLNPASVSGGSNSTGTVTLTAPAGGAGAVVALSSSGSSAHVPTSVTVAAGAATASFTITTSRPGLFGTSSTITAAYNGSSKSATLTIRGLFG